MSWRAHKDAMEKRRIEVAKLVDGSATQREIADKLGISVGTVNNDIRALRKLWREQQVENVNGIMAEDLHRVSAAMKAIWPMVEAGSLKAIDRLIRLIAQRAAILGYEAAKEIDLKSDGKPIQFISQIVAHLDPSVLEKSQEEESGE